MKNKLLILILTFFPFFAKTQTIAISNTRENILYFGVDNPIDAVVENMKGGSFFLTTDNGAIKGESCHFRIHPKKVGKATIYIKKVKKRDTVLIGQRIFRVKNLPKPIARIGGKRSGMINKKVLAVQTGIRACLEDIDICLSFRILSYSVVGLSDQDSLFVYEVKGPRFTNEIKQKFLKLKQNNKVFFVDMLVTWPNGRKEELDPIKFTIK